MLEPAVELGIVAPVLDHATSVRDRGAVAGEQSADFGETQATDDVRQIHGHLPGERGTRRTARRRLQIADVDLEHSPDGRVDDLPYGYVSVTPGLPMFPRCLAPLCNPFRTHCDPAFSM
jgi:hypothetical protein